MITVAADSDRMESFEQRTNAQFDDVTVDGIVGEATRTMPTAEYEYRDLFAERGSEPSQPRAGVGIDVHSASHTVSVTLISSDTADRVEIREDGEVRGELIEVGQTATLEYDAGALGTITVVAISGTEAAVIATKSYAF